MNEKYLQLMAILMIELVLFLPFSMVEAVQITHAPNPAVLVNETSATIEWNTDEESHSEVDYGTSKQLGLVKLDANLVTFHSIVLDSLAPQTRYYFQLHSIAASGNSSIDNNNGQFYSFITGAQGDIVAPEISNISIVALTAVTATIQWKTDEPANSIIYIGEEGQPLDTTKTFPDFVTTHIVTVSASEGVKYNYIVSSCDRFGNCRNSTAQFFSGGADITPPEINVNIPEWHFSGRIDIRGSTEPYSKVELHVNGERTRILQPQMTGEEGKITFLNVALPLDENSITIVAIDQVGLNSTKDYVVKIDPTPPTLVVSGLPSITIQPSATLTINISEPADIFFDVGLDDQIAPRRVADLTEVKVSSSLVEIGWAENKEADFDEYAVYRKADSEAGAEWIRLAILKKNSYQDSKVKPENTYSYRVSAIDKHCNEGPFSSTLAVSVLKGAAVATHALQVKPVNFTCALKVDKVYNDGGSFTKTINFEEGVNKVEITAVDRAGHKVVFRNRTVYDMNPPEIISHNLDQLSPTYIPTVTIIGNVSEKSIVTIYVNEEVAEVVETASDGSFSTPLELSRGTPATDAERSAISLHAPLLSALEGGSFAGGDAGPMWINKVKLVATDLAGASSPPVEQDIVFTTCGYGGWFSVDIGGQPASIFGADSLSPSILNPRLMLEGQEIISFPVNLSYLSAGKVQIMGVNVRKYLPHESMRAEYMPDFEWVSNPTIICDPKTGKTCFVQMNVRAKDPTPAGENWTMFQKEEAISNNRKEDCLIPATGCIKLPMMLEISFKEVTERIGPIQEQYYPGQPRVESLVQKQCWQLEIGIDQRMPLDLLPGGLLRGASDFLNTTINFIDGVLEPLKTIKEYLFYACMLTWVINFFNQISYNLACGSDFIAGLKAIAEGGGQFKVEYAQMGVCDLEYPKNNDDTKESNSKCKDCQEAVERRMALEWNQRQICDRLFCPSAPTLQNYIKKKASKAVKKVEKSPTSTYEGDAYYLGSSCACEITGDGNECTPVPAKKQSPQSTGYDSMKQVYEWYKQEGSAKYEKTAGGAEKCSGPHTAKAKCCGREYMDEWGSACGLPYADEALFDEIKESLCLAGQNTNQPSKLEGFTLSSEGEAGKGTVQCSQTFNSVAGFCEASGKINIEPIPTGFPIKNPLTLPGPAVDKDDKKLYVCLFPPMEGGAKTNYDIKFCYATTKSRVDRDVNYSKDHDKNFIAMQKDFGFYTPPRWGEITPMFAGVGDTQKETAGKNQFCRKMGEHATAVDNEQCRDTYDTIKERIGGEKEYIVDPTSSLLRTVQCLCISGLEAYLSFWKKVLNALMNCFRAIEITGDGSPGVCQAVVSVYICDMIYDLIKCFSEKYSAGSVREDVGGGISSIFGTLTKSGSDISTSVAGRYGDSPMWKAVFVEGKLMHAVCLWAFTGTWDLDMSALLESDSAAPALSSIGFLAPCEMRYKAFNPTTDPSGLTTWNYHFGVGLIPGADLRYTLKLICSEGYECSEADGFERGRCDCRGGQQETVVADPTLTGQLGRNGELNEEIFYTVQTKDYRYNKAKLEWTWTDNNAKQQTDFVECDIGVKGGNPPAFCSFDLAHSAFRCSLGFDNENWINFNDVSPNYPAKYPVAFKLGDPLSFIVDIQQALPRNPDCTTQNCDYTKYLTYEIKRGTSTLFKSEEGKSLNTLGQSIITDFPVQRPITQEAFFESTGQQAQTGYACVAGSPPAGLGQPVCAPHACSSVCTNFNVVVSGTPKSDGNVVLALSKTEFMFFNPSSTSPKSQEEPSFDKTYFPKKKEQGGNMGTKYKLSETRRFNHPSGLTFVIVGDIERKHVEIRFSFTKEQPQTEPPAGTSICSKYNTFIKAKRMPFTIKYSIWKSRKIGGSYSRSEQLEEFQGAPLERIEKFVVVCSDELERAGVESEMDCKERSISPEKADCWCSEGARTEAEFAPETTEFDCGEKSFDPNIFCVDNKCTTIPACEKDETKGTTGKCTCGFKGKKAVVCDKADKPACKWEKDKTPECVTPQCEVKAAEVDYACGCFDVQGKAGEVCTDGQICCGGSTGKCVADIKECPEEYKIEVGWDTAEIMFEGATSVNIRGVNKTTYQAENPITRNAEGTLEYSLKFNVEDSDRVFNVKVESLNELDVIYPEDGINYQSVPDTGYSVNNIKFRITPNDAGKEFKIKVTVQDVANPELIDVKTIIIPVAGVEATPTFIVQSVSFIQPPDKFAKIEKAADGSYYLAKYIPPDGRKYRLVARVGNIEDDDQIDISYYPVGAANLESTATKVSVEDVKNAPGVWDVKYDFTSNKGAVPDQQEKYQIAFVVKNKENPQLKQATQTINVTEYAGIDLASIHFETSKEGGQYSEEHLLGGRAILKAHEFSLKVRFTNPALKVILRRREPGTDKWNQINTWTDYSPAEGANNYYVEHKVPSANTASDSFEVNKLYEYAFEVYDFDGLPFKIPNRTVYIKAGEDITWEGMFQPSKTKRVFIAPGGASLWDDGMYFIDNTQPAFAKIKISPATRLSYDGFRVVPVNASAPLIITWVNDPAQGPATDKEDFYYASVRAKNEETLYKGALKIEVLERGTWKSLGAITKIHPIYVTRLYYLLVRDGYHTRETGTNKCPDSDDDVAEFWYSRDGSSADSNLCIYLEKDYSTTTLTYGERSYTSVRLRAEEWGNDAYPLDIANIGGPMFEGNIPGRSSASDSRANVNKACKYYHKSFLLMIEDAAAGKLKTGQSSWSLLTSKTASNAILPQVSGGKNTNKNWAFLAVKHVGLDSVAVTIDACDTRFPLS